MSTARFFSYGGTRFSERQRLGPWTLNSVEPFNDYTGVPKSGFSIGMIWDSEGVALLVRQQQKDTAGRPSVFTLLLDPGFEVWQKFGWNAAALALALFGEDGNTEYGAILLLRPEELSAGNLDTLLSRVGVSIAPQNNPLFSSLWTGAVVEQDLVVVPFDEAGWDAAPTLAVLAGQVAALPVCFRAGTSWLVGGNRPQARSLSVRFVLNGFEPGPLPQGLAEHGSRLLEEWKLAVRISAELTTFDAQPLARWEGDSGIVLERAQLLASFCSERPEAEDYLPTLLKTLERSGPAAADIRQAALRFAISGGEPMSVVKTNFVLTLPDEIDLGEAHMIAGQLDQEATIAFFSAKCDRSWSGRFNLPVPWRVRIWRLRLEREIGAETAINVLEAALLDLPEQEHADLMRRTVSQSRSPLYQWFSFFEKHRDWEAKVSNFLQAQARTEFATGTAESALSYLAFGNDPGGRLLATRDLNHQAATLFADRLRQEARRDNSILAESARAWLDAMAGSPLRLCVELKLKLALARGSGVSGHRSRRWRWLRRLEQLYLGQKVRFLPASIPEGERDFLRREFAEMLARPLGKNVPQLAQISRLLEGVPEKLIGPLSKLAVVVEHADAWDNQLRQSGLSDAAERFLAHVAVRGNNQEIRRCAFRKVEEATLIKELTRLVRDLRETGSPISAKRFGDFLEDARDDDQLREKMGVVIRGTWQSENENNPRFREWLLTVLAREPALFLEFTAGFEEALQLDLLASLEKISPQPMRVESVRAARLLDRGKPIDRRTKALLRFMHSRAGEQLRKIAGRDAYQGGVKAFEHHLCGLFGARRTAPVTPRETRMGKLKRMFGLFQHRPAR